MPSIQSILENTERQRRSRTPQPTPPTREQMKQPSDSIVPSEHTHISSRIRSQHWEAWCWPVFDFPLLRRSSVWDGACRDISTWQGKFAFVYRRSYIARELALTLTSYCKGGDGKGRYNGITFWLFQLGLLGLTGYNGVAMILGW